MCVFQLYGLYKTAKDGPATQTDKKKGGSVSLQLSETYDMEMNIASDSSSTIAERQLAAWKSCGQMSSLLAMRLFIVTLYTAYPHWDYTLH